MNMNKDVCLRLLRYHLVKLTTDLKSMDYLITTVVMEDYFDIDDAVKLKGQTENLIALLEDMLGDWGFIPSERL